MSDSPGKIIRETRQRKGLSQAQLAIRLGTKQSAISRLENDETSPSFSTLQKALLAMGEEVELNIHRSGSGQDPVHLEDLASRPPTERLKLGLSWNRLALRLREAGLAAKAPSR